jgi:hypothetical protein
MRSMTDHFIGTHIGARGITTGTTPGVLATTLGAIIIIGITGKAE